MMEEGKKINFYRLGLENGRRYRMELTDEYRLIGTGGGVFLYLAPVYDSRDRDGSWHRLVLEGDFYRCKYEVLVMATNENLTEQTEKAGKRAVHGSVLAEGLLCTESKYR